MSSKTTRQCECQVAANCLLGRGNSTQLLQQVQQAQQTQQTQHSQQAQQARPAQQTNSEILSAPAAPRTRVKLAHSKCPFCTIAMAYPPLHPWNHRDRIPHELDPSDVDPNNYVIYSGDYVMAFLDLAPLTYGHTLVIPRIHREKMGDLEACYAAEVSVINPFPALSCSSGHFPLYRTPSRS